LKSIISHSWDKIELPNAEIISLLPFRYNHVSSRDLYENVKKIAEFIKCEKIIAKVDDISLDEDGSYVLIGDKKLRGSKIFDSRTPVYLEASVGEIHIYQSFVGWMVELSEEFKNPGAFRFMDFNIEQQRFTQFVYVLPFSNKKALIEVTRFGAEIINKVDAEVLLQAYIEKNYGKFIKLDTEQGCIPMSNAQIKNDILPEVTYLGSRNYNIKSSTGYAFKNMFYHGNKIAESIKKNESTEVYNKYNSNVLKGRFTFYDGLLLDILKNRPNYGTQIFINLLKKVKIQIILKFLDEKTNLKEDISIFANLPWTPFIAAIGRKPKFQFFFRPLVLLFVSILLLLLGNGTSTQSILGYTLLLLGMLMVGLPHGALDHLLETGNWSYKLLPKFILKYVSISAFMGGIWFLFPTLALGIFLVYSSWHFGQADGKLWVLPHITSFLWGISLLYYLLGTHTDETKIILSSMGNLKLSLVCPVWGLLPWLVLALYKKNIPFVITILWLTIISFLPLIFAFGIYFIGQHSINGWIEIKNKLNLSNKSIWLHALPFHLAAWLLMLMYYLIFLNQNQDKTIVQWGVFFIFLSCISLPHIIIMNTLYFKKGK
jgi:lycopene beta-cyclase